MGQTPVIWKGNTETEALHCLFQSCDHACFLEGQNSVRTQISKHHIILYTSQFSLTDRMIYLSYMGFIGVAYRMWSE